jgi:cytochrome P450 family 142 subfamily A polypeptide 1
MQMTKPYINFLDGAFYADDPLSAYAWLRENAPVYYDEVSAIWGVTRYDHVREISRHPEQFSSANGSRPYTGAMPMMIDMDAPEHVTQRRRVSAGFTPVRVRAMGDRIQQVCDAIIDDVCEQGEAEFVHDVAAQLPLIAIADLLGVKQQDRADLLRWSDDMLIAQGSTDETLLLNMMNAFMGYDAYIREVIAERRETGQDTDLIGILANTEVDGELLPVEMLIHETLLLLIGGDETTRHVITGGIDELLRHPDQMEYLRANPDAIPLAVEEMLRWVTPIKNMNRTVVSDIDFHGTPMKAGDQVLLFYPSANRDAAKFDRPDEFDVTRSPNEHMAFGFGAHHCLGNQLARLELKCMVDTVLRRLPNLEVTTPGPLAQRPASFVSGIIEMPVRFTPSTKIGAGPV